MHVDIAKNPDMPGFYSYQIRQLCLVRTFEGIYDCLFTALLVAPDDHPSAQVVLLFGSRVGLLDSFFDHRLLDLRLFVEIGGCLCLGDWSISFDAEFLLPGHDRLVLPYSVVPPADLHMLEGARG